MRPTILFSIAAAGMLVTSTPKSGEAAMTGTYRLVISSPRATPTDGFLVLEEAGNHTAGTLVLAEGHPTALANIVVSDTLLTADLKTTAGAATLQLHIAGRDVAGEIVRDRTHFTVVGFRAN